MEPVELHADLVAELGRPLRKVFDFGPFAAGSATGLNLRNSGAVEGCLSEVEEVAGFAVVGDEDLVSGAGGGDEQEGSLGEDLAVVFGGVDTSEFGDRRRRNGAFGYVGEDHRLILQTFHAVHGGDVNNGLAGRLRTIDRGVGQPGFLERIDKPFDPGVTSCDGADRARGNSLVDAVANVGDDGVGSGGGRRESGYDGWVTS